VTLQGGVSDSVTKRHKGEGVFSKMSRDSFFWQKWLFFTVFEDISGILGVKNNLSRQFNVSSRPKKIAFSFKNKNALVFNQKTKLWAKLPWDSMKNKKSVKWNEVNAIFKVISIKAI